VTHLVTGAIAGFRFGADCLGIAITTSEVHARKTMKAPTDQSHLRQSVRTTPEVDHDWLDGGVGVAGPRVECSLGSLNADSLLTTWPCRF